MKVSIGNFVLADGVTSFVSGYNEDVQTTIQEDKPIRADATKYRDRGNKSTSISFSVTRLHGSLRAAFAFLLSHGAEAPGQGLIAFEATDGGGRTVRYLVNGVLAQVGSSFTGATTFHRYQIRGGVVSQKKTG